jgi:hypothetical protein
LATELNSIAGGCRWDYVLAEVISDVDIECGCDGRCSRVGW